MELYCRNCDADIPAADVNLDSVLAKCRKCNAVFDFSDQVRMSATPAKQKRDRGEIPLPKAFQVEDLGTALSVTRKWGRGIAAFFVVFAVFWNSTLAIVGVLAAKGVLQETGKAAPFGGYLWLFLTPFVLVGLTTAYLALALLFNRTLIEVRDGVLSVSHGPIAWPGGRRLEVDQIDQLYCTEYLAYVQNNVPQYRIALHALTKSGERLKLVRGMDDAGQGIYLEQLLENHLRIEDRPVDGELRA